MHEDEKNKNAKKGRRFPVRRKDYIDAFRWDFVDGGSVDKDNDDPAAVKSPAAKTSVPRNPAAKTSAPKNRKENDPPKRDNSVKGNTVKGTPKTAVRDGKVTKRMPIRSAPSRALEDKTRNAATFDVFASGFGDDGDLTVPSYGKTPIPTDDELEAVREKVKKQTVRDVLKKTVKTTTRPRETTSFTATVQRSVDAGEAEYRSVKTVESPIRNNCVEHPPFASEMLARRESREQMVWDPERREYVPLLIKKPPLVEKVREVREEPKKKYRQEEKRKESERGVVLPPNLPVLQQPSKPPRPPQQLSPKLLKQRGDVPHFVESKCPDPADAEAEPNGFVKLGVSVTMLDALRAVRYIEPTPIQAGVFEQVKAGVDLMGQAQTGTGKTAAFSIPIIEGVEQCPPGDDPVALILVPTRELAVQVRDEAVRLAYGRDLRITALYGGKPLASQIDNLRGGVDIIVGTPGRVLDLMNRGSLSLDALRWVVLDEADRMLDIGFRPDIEKILRKTPSERQTLLFSATLAPPVVKLAEKYMKSPQILDFSPKGVAGDTIEQFYVTVDPERKFDALVCLLQQEQPRQAIIFVRTKRGADRLARLLSRRFESLSAIHGDLSQPERDKVMKNFRAGTLRYLVATDVVGRGIDVSGISHIINYDIPAFCDDYVHRVGRTGRMGREGVAYTFVTVAEGSELTRIEIRIDKLLQRAELKGFEAFAKPVARDEDEQTSAEQEPLEVKPVFGKRVRKIRRAL